MWLGVVSLFPDMIRSALAHGVTGRAIEQDRLSLNCYTPRDDTTDRHRTVDDRPFGGGAGMVMMAGPLLDCVARARRDAVAGTRVVFMSAQGTPLTQARAGAYAGAPGLLLLCGRYEGIDQRVLEVLQPEEVSIGDYVVSGGELPALVLIDAIARQLPGVLGNPESKSDESHLDGRLEYPQYTRPENVAGLGVPPVLLSGDHAAIARWRRRQSLLTTWRKRPDMLTRQPLSEDERALLRDVDGWARQGD